MRPSAPAARPAPPGAAGAALRPPHPPVAGPRPWNNATMTTTSTPRTAVRPISARALRDFMARHPTIHSLAWALPFLVFLAFPIGSALDEGLDTLRGAGMLTTSVLIGGAYLATWIFNPVPRQSERLTTRFTITHSVLLGAELAAFAFGHIIGVPGTFPMLSYQTSAWVLQSPRRIYPSGTAALVALTCVQASADGYPFYYGLYVLFPVIVTTMARHAIDRDNEERLVHQQALLVAKDRERLRLSGDLHDILGHSLTAIHIKAQLAARFLDAGRAEEAAAQVDDLIDMSQSALSDVRAIVAENRRLSPREELESARNLLEVARIDVIITNTGEPPAGIRSSLAGHVIREGITNAIAHAHPTRVWIALSPTGVSVTNDGYSASFSRSSSGSGTGLEGLRERAATEGTVTWGPTGSTWRVALAFHGTGADNPPAAHEHPVIVDAPQPTAKGIL